MLSSFKYLKKLIFFFCFIFTINSGVNASSFFIPQDQEYPLEDLKITNSILIHLNDKYVEPQRIDPALMLNSAIESLEREIQELVIKRKDIKEKDGREFIEYEITLGNSEASFHKYPKPQSIWDVSYSLRPILKKFAPKLPTHYDKKEIEYSIINGILSTLDPHTTFLNPDNFREMKLGTQGEFGGLGIVISIRDGKLTVISPMEGTPASRAGIKAKDVITRIEKESTASMTLNEAVSRLRGKRGTQVNIWIDRKGYASPKLFTLTRDIIKIISVQSQLLENNVGYIKIRNFNEKLKSDIDNHLKKIKTASKAENGISGLILDLRNNPGGILNQAINLVDTFIKKGVIVSTEERGKKMNEVRAKSRGTENSYPLVILINGGSASASEIVAGALKNHNRALILGSQSFGKGSVQILQPNIWDKSALKMTIAQWLTPGDIGIQNIGVIPHINLFEVSIEKEGFNYFVQQQNWREEYYSKNLKNERAQVDKPIYSMKYIGLKNTEEEEEDYSKIVIDFPIEAGLTLIQKLSAEDLDKVLANADKVMAPLRKKQIAKQIEHFSKLGVKWTDKESASEEKASLSTKIKLKPAKKSYKPGETVEIETSVTNKSKTAVNGVYGITKSANLFLENREFVFGEIKPGETRKWAINLKIPASNISRLWNFKINIKDDKERLLANPEQSLVIDTSKTPQFIISRSIKEIGDKINGKLDNGEKIEIEYEILNKGSMDAAEITANLRNKSFDFLTVNAGRASIEKIAKGKKAKAKFSFTVKKVPEKKDLRLHFSLIDGKTGAYGIDYLVFENEDLFKLQSKKQKRSLPLNISISKETWTKAHETDEISTKLNIINADGLHDLAVFANNKKILYLSDLKKKKSVPLKLKLEKKENTLTIIARNEHKTPISKTYLLLYPKAEKRR